MPASVTSPAQNGISSTADYGLGSPTGYATPPRRAGFNNAYSSGSPQSTRQHRYSVSSSSQGLRTPQSSSRASFGSNSRAATMLQDPIASSLTGVSQISVVQEMAFRQGQRDHGTIREHLPASPFYREFDKVWADFYALGKECGGTPITAPTTTPSSHHNFPWPVLINAYTQDLEHPNGTVDSEYVRKICNIALTCMAVLVGTVIRREGDWRKTVCDVPLPIRQALQGFEDLRVRYERLKRDAHEAGAGGLPGGY
ncbi:hypothetical protein BDU57DRAFT_520282 [Ampelomyces quisqualis]|uniref:Uncharacterized protein n=1 Tax=Ampelomyces quisqualis TaxID=50730 RepID=A0A6A5QI11_AMPQU|nr:hypothetical protein BDU57DRAFT_520282 [Ampelomyces quisqualis]